MTRPAFSSRSEMVATDIDLDQEAKATKEVIFGQWRPCPKGKSTPFGTRSVGHGGLGCRKGNKIFGVRSRNAIS
jgi:hypothetical protein